MNNKILIGIPCMDQVAAPFTASLAMLDKAGFDCVVDMITGSLIYDSRNKIAGHAVETEADYILWLDSDMEFKPDTLARLMDDIKAGADIASGLYFRRGKPYTPVAFDSIDINDDGTAAGFKDYSGPLTGVHEVGGVGFGCVLMKADCIIDVFAKYGTCFTPLAGFGEDLSFCWRAKNLGYKIMLDTAVKCGHVGHVIITEDFYKAYCGGANNANKS